jgi:hypothetical protein
MMLSVLSDETFYKLLIPRDMGNLYENTVIVNNGGWYYGITPSVLITGILKTLLLFHITEKESNTLAFKTNNSGSINERK